MDLNHVENYLIQRVKSTIHLMAIKMMLFDCQLLKFQVMLDDY